MDGLIYVVGGGDGKDWLCSAEVHFHSSQYKSVPDDVKLTACRCTTQRKMFGDPLPTFQPNVGSVVSVKLSSLTIHLSHLVNTEITVVCSVYPCLIFNL